MLWSPVARGAAVAVGAFLVIGLGGAGATAASPGARLAVTVRPATGPSRAAWLTCAPAGGTHANAAAACADLQAAGGDPARIEPQDGMCTMDYAPVKVTLRGRWHGRVVRYRQTFGNACAMALATRTVFRLQTGR